MIRLTSEKVMAENNIKENNLLATQLSFKMKDILNANIPIKIKLQNRTTQFAQTVKAAKDKLIEYENMITAERLKDKPKQAFLTGYNAHKTQLLKEIVLTEKAQLAVDKEMADVQAVLTNIVDSQDAIHKAIVDSGETLKQLDDQLGLNVKQITQLEQDKRQLTADRDNYKVEYERIIKTARDYNLEAKDLKSKLQQNQIVTQEKEKDYVKMKEEFESTVRLLKTAKTEIEKLGNENVQMFDTINSSLGNVKNEKLEELQRKIQLLTKLKEDFRYENIAARDELSSIQINIEGRDRLIEFYRNSLKEENRLKAERTTQRKHLEMNVKEFKTEKFALEEKYLRHVKILHEIKQLENNLNLTVDQIKERKARVEETGLALKDMEDSLRLIYSKSITNSQDLQNKIEDLKVQVDTNQIKLRTLKLTLVDRIGNVERDKKNIEELQANNEDITAEHTNLQKNNEEFLVQVKREIEELEKEIETGTNIIFLIFAR